MKRRKSKLAIQALAPNGRALEWTVRYRPRGLKLVIVSPGDFVGWMHQIPEETFVVGRYFGDGNIDHLPWTAENGVMLADRIKVVHDMSLGRIDAWECVNEPIVYTPDAMRRLAEFQRTWAVRMRGHGLSPIVGNFSVGNPQVFSADGINLMQHFKPAMKEGEYFCYHPDTDILTEDGWRNIAEFVEKKMAVKVATLNPSSNQVEFHLPTQYYKFAYRDQLVEYESRSLSFSVTPNHQIWCRPMRRGPRPQRKFINPSNHNVGFMFRRADQIPHAAELRRDFPYDGTEQEWFQLPSCRYERYKKEVVWPMRQIKMDAWLWFLGIYLAEGHVQKYNSRPQSVLITQCPGETCDKIRQCIESIGNIAEYYPPRSYRSAGDFYIGDAQLAVYLDRLGKAKDKYIPREFLSLSRRQSKILLDALMAGDGSVTGVPYYCTASIQLANDFQELALKAGYSATLSQHCDGQFYINLGNIRLTPKTHPRFCRRVSYDGPVYCIEVANHLIFARRGGKPCWLGNSYHGYGCPEAMSHPRWQAQRYNELFVDAGMSMPVILTECGRDCGSTGHGYKEKYSDGQYIPQLIQLDQALQADKLVKLATIFCLGTYGNWKTFDLTENAGRLLGEYIVSQGDIEEEEDMGTEIKVVMPDGLTIRTMDLEEYKRGVVPREAIASWGDLPNGMEVLKAQAVAAGTYAAFAIFHPRHGNAAVCTTAHCQVWTKATDHRTDQAVRETAGAFVTKDGDIIQTQYISYCGTPECPLCQGQNGYDGKTWYGRMCQWGAKFMAVDQGKTWRQILRFYYPQGDWGEPPDPPEDWTPYTMRGEVTVTLGGHELELPVTGQIEMRQNEMPE